MHRLTKYLLLLLCCWGCLGCSGGGDEVETAPLNGEVKMENGDPVAGATVVFYPEAGPSVVAKTDDAGKFTAQVPLGECKVAVVANASTSSDDMSPESLAAQKKEEAKKAKIKPSFASPGSSGLTVTVKPKQEEIVRFVVN